MLKKVALLESIIHIEDLSPRDFIREIETLNEKIITEKLDGANLWFGVDEKGFFTSREGKSPKQKRFYSVDDYPLIANYNGFRAAHLALERAKKVILKYLSIGNMIEIEVVFGEQPNTIYYETQDKNYIVILRAVNGTDDSIAQKLGSALNGQEVTVVSKVLTSSDGNTLQTIDSQLKWKFAMVSPIKGIDSNNTEITSLLSELKSFLNEKNEKRADFSNDEIIDVSLTKIPKDERDVVKAEKTRLKQYILEKYKLPIKKILLSKFVKKIKPMINTISGDQSAAEVEGVVIRDPKSDDQVKIVDRDVFTAINFFNSTVRSQVSGTVKTTDQDAPIELRGGAFGQAKIRIANILGLKDLALTAGMKKVVSKFKSDSPLKTAENIAESLNIQNLDSIQRKVSAVLENAIREINDILTTFKSESNKYVLRLKSGNEIKFSPAVMNRTLTAFAETKNDISTIISGVKRAKSSGELIFALYGNTIKKILTNKGNEDVKEHQGTKFSILKAISEDDAAPAAAAPVGASTATAAAGGESEPSAEVQQATTKSGAIAPYQHRLLNGKIIVRRKKTFTPFKKFKRPAASESAQPLMKAINEMQDGKNVNPVNNTADVLFNQLRNRLNTNSINSTDVSNYLNKAHEINDEVDSIAFGLELDDGKIVKVYIDAAQADDFEKELGKMLGKEDDIEDVINQMAQKYNIVDVVWPEDKEKEESADNLGDENDLPKPSEDEPPLEIHTELNKPELEEPETDQAIAKEPTGQKYKNLRNLVDITSSEENEGNSLKNSSGQRYKNLKSLLDGRGDERSSAGDDVKSGTSSYKNLKKLINKEEIDVSLITDNFKLIVEAQKRVKDKDKKSKEMKKDSEELSMDSMISAELQNLLRSFPAKQDKIIITLMVRLGAPVSALAIYSHLLRTTIEEPAERYLKNASFRMWTKKLLAAINKAEKTAPSTVSESLSFDRRLQTKYQHMAYNVLVAIGMPNNIEKTSTKELLEGIRKISKLAIENSDVRLNLTAIAEELGVADETRIMPDAPPAAVKEQVQLMDNALRAKETVLQFIKMFGIDASKNISVDKQLEKPLVANYLRHLGSSADNLNRLDALIKRMQKLRMATESSNYSNDREAIFEQDSNWIFAYLASSGMNLRSGSMSIKLDSDEAEKLKNAFVNEQEETIVSKNGTSYRLVPSDDGFQIVEEDDENATDIFTSEDIQQILSLME